MVRFSKFIGIFLFYLGIVAIVIGTPPGLIWLGIYVYRTFGIPPEAYILSLIAVVGCGYVAWVSTYGEGAKDT